MFYTVDQYGVHFSDDKTELIAAPQDLSGTYTIPETVSKIRRAAFQNCSNLEWVVLPESLTEIPDNAFEYCKKLIKVEINSSINSIGRQSFSCCDSLKEINLPASLLSIGFQAFVNCTSLEKIAIPDSCKCSERVFEGCNNLAQIEIPDSWTEIPEAIFSHCESLEEITIPNGIIKISNSAFENCSSLYNVYIPDSVEHIGKRVFANCTTLSRIRLGLKLKYLGKECFDHCYNINTVFWDPVACEGASSVFVEDVSCENTIELKHFHIGAQVKKLPSFLCQNLSQLEEIIIPNNVEVIGEGAFYHCNPLYLYLGKNVTFENIKSFFSDYHSVEVYDTQWEHNTFGSCYRLEKIEVSKQNPYLSSKNGNLYDKSFSTLIKLCAPRMWAYYDGTYQGDGDPISLVLDVEHIADFACYRLNIGKLLIKNCTDIGKFAFYGCGNLESVSFGEMNNQKEWNSYNSDTLPFDDKPQDDLQLEKSTDSSNNKISIGTFAFGDCPNLTSISWNITDGNFRIAESYQIWGRYGGSRTTRGDRDKREYDFSQQIKELKIGPSVFALPPFMSKLLAVEELTIPNNIKDIVGGLPPNLKRLNIETCSTTDAERNFIYDNGIILSKDGQVFIRYIGDTEELAIPEGVTAIADSALSHSSIKRVICPATLESIGSSAFTCSKIETFEAPDKLSIIGDEAFKDCSQLVNLKLNDNLEEIGNRVFENCKLLPQFSIKQTTKIGFDIIRGCCSIKELKINIESLNLLGLDGLQSIIWNCKGEKTKHFHGETDNTTFVQYKRYGDFKDGDVSYSYNTEDSVAHKIQKLIFTENVEFIPDYFADYMQIEEVDIPKNVKSIGHKAFWNCPKLKRIVVHSMDIDCGIDFCHFDNLGVNVANRHIACVATKIIFNEKDVTDLFKERNQKLHSDIDEEEYWKRELERDTAYALGYGEEYDREQLRNDPDYNWFI